MPWRILSRVLLAHRARAFAVSSWVGLAATLFLLTAQVATADTSYWRVATDRVTVVSDSSARRCQKVAFQFLTFDRVLRELAGLDEDVRFPPLTVYVLSDADARRVFLTEADRRQQVTRNMRIYSKYLPGPDFNVAAVVDAGDIEQPLQSVMLLYAESILANGPTGTYPPWYTFGIAYMTDGLIIRDDGSVWLSRAGPFQPDVERSAHVRYQLVSLLSTTHSDLASGAGDWKTFMPRARDWAQFGLLTTPERRAHYRELAMLLRQGTPVDQAVGEAFGSTLDSVATEFEDGRWQRSANFKLPPANAATAVPAAEQVAAGQIDSLLQVVADRVSRSPPH